MGVNREQWEAVCRARALVAEGKSLSLAADLLGVRVSALKRWLAAAEAPGDEGRRGRLPAIELTLAEANRLRFLRLCKDNSLPLAVEAFLGDEVCRPETAAALEAYFQRAREERRRVYFPKSLQRLTMPTDEEKAMFRQRKHSQDFELVVRRGLTWVDDEGRERPMEAMTLLESDDMSLNQPYRWVNPNGGGEVVSRQALISIDVFSHYWVGASLVGRPRDAYQAEDVADHFLQVVRSWGLPTAWRLERGTWESNFVDGIRLEDGSYWGGLNSCKDENGLFAVMHTWKSRGKGTVENGFNYVQSLLSHSAMDIGRRRGEYDFAARQLRRAQHGQADALAQFWSIDEASDGLMAALAKDNATGKVRRAHGNLTVRADELFPPRVVVPCPAGELWRFLPCKVVRTVQKGAVTVKLPNWPRAFEFRLNHERSPFFIPQGFKVFVAFHPGRAHEGAHVFCALRQGDPANRNGWSLGQFLTVAPLVVEAPQFSLSRRGQYNDQQKEHNAAMRTEFRQVVPAGAHPGLRTSSARDGLGAALHVQAGEARGGAGEVCLEALPTPRAVDPARELAARNAREVPAARPRRRDLEALKRRADESLFGE